MEEETNKFIENEDHYYPHYRSPVVNTFFWQLLGSVSSAAVVALFFWLWNVTLDIRDLQNARADIARAMVQADAARVIIDRNSDRLVKLEAIIEQQKGNLISAENAREGLRSEIRQLRDTLHAHIIEMSRLTETVHQMERVLQSRFGESELQQRYQPWSAPQLSDQRNPHKP